jgi:hypothetical protein
MPKKKEQERKSNQTKPKKKIIISVPKATPFPEDSSVLNCVNTAWRVLSRRLQDER